MSRQRRFHDHAPPSATAPKCRLGFHPFMEDSDDFDYSRLNRAIVEHMNWFFHFRLRSIDARMTQMKTAEPGRELISRLGERVFGIGCDCSDRCSKEEGVAASTIGSPSLSAGGQKVRKMP